MLGIGPDLIRLSVGIEEWEDLVEDVEQALEWAVVGHAQTSGEVTAVNSDYGDSTDVNGHDVDELKAKARAIVNGHTNGYANGIKSPSIPVAA